MISKEVKIEYREVSVEKQRIEELVDDNKDYIAWLEEEYGKYSSQVFIAYLDDELSVVPRTGTMTRMPMITLAQGSISFFPYTTHVKFGKVKDPINLIFSTKGSAYDVATLMGNRVSPQWTHAIASTQYTWIDNMAHGAPAPQWVKMTHTLSPDGVWGMLGTRRHLRLFHSAYRDTHDPGYGQYSLGTVHKDNLLSHIALPFLGRPVDFDKTQEEVENAFSSLGCPTSKQTLQPNGEVINGIQHDGLATIIELM